jgi:alpha-beta hydrolase superfamily lysophospholipase
MTPTMDLPGARGRLNVHRWLGDDPRYVVLIAHGYGEHAGRYAHVAERLVGAGAAVYAADHLGHGRSEGDRALVEDAEELVDDLRSLAHYARGKHHGLPRVLLGHSMGGLLATRFAQRYPDELDVLVLSAPVIGGNPDIEALLALDPMPEVPIDPGALSRDPAVGEAYAADPLVHHGPFSRTTLEAMFAAVRAVGEGPGFDELPTLWIHGDEDPLAPLGPTREAIAGVRGSWLEERVYPGARHEVLNEINRDEVLADVLAFLDRALADLPARARP